MRFRTRTRVLVVLCAVATLVAAACGTRVDRDSIIRAADTGAGPAATQAGPGEPGALGDVPGATAGPGSGPTSGQALDGTAQGVGPSSGKRGSTAGGTAEGPGGAGSPGEPIVIGTVGAYSGPGGAALAQGARALQVWGAHVNSNGGINGRPVKVIVMDDGGDASKARSLMKQLVEEHNAVAVVAAMTVVETLNSWRGYVEDKQVPIVGGSCGPEWTKSPMLFRQCPASPQQIFGTAVIGAKYAKSDKFGGLFCSETQSCTFVEKELFDKGGAKRAGLDPQYRARISVFQADYTAECIQARNAGVELLMVVGDPGTVERVASSCQRQNYTPQYLQISSTMRADAITKPGLSDVLLGMSTFPFAGLSTPAFREFSGAWERYGDGSAPGPAAAQGWASAKLFEQAAKAAGGQISRASIISELRTLRNERLGGLTTPMTFTPEGPADSNCVFVMHGKGGQWTAPRGDTPECW
ncbi:MAG: ABC transporter substrate-binding protein [Actinophytocola sp.]|nr:ABC transporter substrate-binding protein [Actinophytocola sp.]